MLTSLSFKRGRLCQSSQIRKTEVAERLYLAWGVEEGAVGGEDRRGTAEPLCIPSGSFSRRSRELAWWPHEDCE